MKIGFKVLLIIFSFLLYPFSGLLHAAEQQQGKHIETAWNETGYTRPSDAELRKTLSPLQYKVIRENRSEPPFRNGFWDNDREGIYVDVVSGEPLFSSLDKFRSGTGRPSFTKPLEPDNIIEKHVRRLFFIRRTQVKSRLADSHLGYLDRDDSSPTGLRYSVNSAALRFIPKEDLQKEGYGIYSRLFSCDKRKGVC